MSNEQGPGEYPSRPGDGSNSEGSSADGGYPTQKIPTGTGDSGSQGYPQQNQQHPPGQPPQGYGQQGAYPQGPSQQGYGQQYQQGYAPQGGGYGEPPRKSKTPLIVAIVVVVVALTVLGIIWAVVANRAEVAAPAPTVPASATPSADPQETLSEEPSESPSAPSPEPVEPSATHSSHDGSHTRPTEPPETNGQPPAVGSVPLMPEKVGEFTAVGEVEDGFAIWTGPNSANYNATYLEDVDKKLFAEGLTDPEEEGIWICSDSIEGLSQCATDAHDGAVLLTGTGSRADAIAFGTELLTLWK